MDSWFPVDRTINTLKIALVHSSSILQTEAHASLSQNRMTGTTFVAVRKDWLRLPSAIT